MTDASWRWLYFCGGAGAFMAIRDGSGPEGAAPPAAAHGAAGSHAAPASAARAQVALDPGQAATIKLQAAPVTRQDVSGEVRVVATVVPDESRISHIHTRVSGWVEKLHVSNTGEYVRAGQPIVDIFSQELYVSQVEYLSLRALGGPPTAVVESGRARLRYFGMSEGAIDAIEKSGKPLRLVTLSAPRSGILARRAVVAGTAVDPSTEIATVLDLSRVWVWAEVPGSDAAGLRPGMSARLDFGSTGAEAIQARVEFVDPVLSETTRKLKVRFSLPNAHGQLRPGSYGTAVFRAAPRLALTVPREALVDTGDAQYVYVLEKGGVYTPRAVRAGARLRDRIEVLEGVSEGESVAASGVFLLDSESRLRASGGQGTSHAGHGAPAAPAAKEAPDHAHQGMSHD